MSWIDELTALLAIDDLFASINPHPEPSHSRVTAVYNLAVRSKNHNC